MLKKVGKAITNNFGLKLLSLLLAIFLWLIVVNVDDPKITRTFTTSITVENESAITNQGKYYEIKNNKNTVTFSVYAKRSLVEQLSGADFKAVADMQNIENLSKVPIQISALHYASQITVVKKDQYLDVKVENLQSRSFIITAQETGNPSNGSVIGNVSVSPNVVKVSGPEKIVSKIDNVVATIDVSNMSTNISENLIPKFYNVDAKEIDTTNLSLSVSSVTVSAEILGTKDVKLNFEKTGQPATGYQFQDIKYTPQTISVKGTPEDLNKLDTIDIPAEVLDISKAQGNIEKTIDISSYLPTGVTLVDDSKKNVDVTVEIQQLTTKIFAIPTTEITINNLSSNYTATFDSGTVGVQIEGLSDSLNQLTVQGIGASVDATGLKTGNHTVKLKLNLPGDLKETSAQTTKITVAKK